MDHLGRPGGLPWRFVAKTVESYNQRKRRSSKIGPAWVANDRFRDTALDLADLESSRTRARHEPARRWVAPRMSACHVRGWRAVLLVALDGGDDLGSPVGWVLVSEEVDKELQACAAFCWGKCQGLLQGVDEVCG